MDIDPDRKIRELEDRWDNFTENPKEVLLDNWAFFAVSSVFLLALYLRYLPEQGMKYLQALDPFWIFRQSQHLAYEGNIPAVDFMRYFPYNTPFHQLNVGEIVFPAILFNIGGFLFFENYLEWAQFYPALMGALGVVVTYFLGKELFDRYAGISAAFFLATIPGVLHRTSAGFFEKEPIGTLFMLLSLYFFTRAWRREEWWSGILSGFSLGIFTISWGGSQMLWLLYPAIVGITMLLNEDTENLVIAYTPTVILGGGFAAIFNPARFSLTGPFFVANMGMILFLWSRYLVEELKLIRDRNLKYYTPAVSIFGIVALLLSPLYSSFVYSRFRSILNKGTQNVGGVISGTVAENQAAGLNQLVGQLGANSAANFFSQLPAPNAVNAITGALASAISNAVGAWTLSYIGLVMIGTYVTLMVSRKLGLVEEEVSLKTFHGFTVGVLFGWSMIFASIFQGSVLATAAPAFLVFLGGMGIVQALKENETVRIEYRWYYLIPLLWVVTNIIGAVSRSRLIFLSAFSVAFIAGYAFSRAYQTLREMDYGDVGYIGYGALLLLLNGIIVYLGTVVIGDVLIAGAVVIALDGILIYLLENQGPGIEELVSRYPGVKPATLAGLLVIVVSINLGAGFVNAQSLGGSPNQLWQENLDYMRENTQKGDVMMSWWDYGYWFESVGRRAAIADGGNAGYYSNEEKINFPLAEFLTSDNPSEWTDWLEKHSVDYVILDETMIGKYTAVSQIARRSNNDFRSMLQLGTSRNIRNSLRRDSQNNTLVQFSRGNLNLYLPINSTREGVEIESAPTIEAGSRGPVNCMLTDEGIRNFNSGNTELPGRFFGIDEQRVEVCVAINPYYNIERSIAASSQGQPRPARAVLVPRQIADHTLVRLYLMDGQGLDMFEKVEEGSPADFVKMWEYTGTEDE